jgi:hypothetical protein
MLRFCDAAMCIACCNAQAAFYRGMEIRAGLFIAVAQKVTIHCEHLIVMCHYIWLYEKYVADIANSRPRKNGPKCLHNGAVFLKRVVSNQYAVETLRPTIVVAQYLSL